MSESVPLPHGLAAVIITHAHPNHCVDIYGLHVMLRYALEQDGLPVFAPEGAEARLGTLVATWGDTFDWNAGGRATEISDSVVLRLTPASSQPAATNGFRARLVTVVRIIQVGLDE